MHIYLYVCVCAYIHPYIFLTLSTKNNWQLNSDYSYFFDFQAPQVGNKSHSTTSLAAFDSSDMETESMC